MIFFRKWFLFVVVILLLPLYVHGNDVLTSSDFEVCRVFQTVGQGSSCGAIMRIGYKGNDASTGSLREIIVQLTDEALHNVDAIEVYATQTPEFYAVDNPQLLSSSAVRKKEIKLVVKTDYIISRNDYLWVTCRVKKDAVIGQFIDVALKSIVLQQNKLRRVVDFPKNDDHLQGNGLKIFKQQQFLFVPTTDDCRFYRIPSMIMTADGGILVAADRRYDSNSDLGEHKIDVAVRHSEDDGLTWSEQRIIATGDGQSDCCFGYGDAALVRTKSGRIICIMAAGRNNFFRGMRHIGVVMSDDNGKTWTKPRELTASNFTDEANNLKDSLGFWSIFVTSGKGLCLPDGRVLFAANCIDRAGTYNIDCHILSSADDGESWTLQKENAYTNCDESKLELMNDGSLLLSVRQDGARGFNISETEGCSDIMLHTLCNSPERKNLTLFRSLDCGQSWHSLLTIQEGGAAYSTMLQLANGDVAILYEDDSYSAGNGYYINYVVVSKEQIVQ